MTKLISAIGRRFPAATLSGLTALGIWLFAVNAMAYSIENGRIVDAAGEKIELRGISIYGANERGRLVMSGLYRRGYKALIAELRSYGFNAVRLPFCPQTLTQGPIPPDFFWVNKQLNPDLFNPDGSGKTPLQILSLVVEEFDRQQFYILLDHHTTDCKNIGPLWYAEGYTEDDWIEDLLLLAKRFAHLEYFLGLDIKNEPHGTTWAQDEPETDWNAAAGRAAKVLLDAAPNMLIFLQGTAGNGNCGGNDYPYWHSDWGGNLARQLCEPVDIPKSKLVLSPHVYGPDEGIGGKDTPYFFTSDPRDAKNNPGDPEDIKYVMPQVWDQFFGRLAEPENGNYSIAIGEFKTIYGRLHGENDPIFGIESDDSGAEKALKRRKFHEKLLRSKPWADALIGYLNEKGITDTFWWAANGDGAIGGMYYGNATPRPDGSIHPNDEWKRVRREVVTRPGEPPGLLNRLWFREGCSDGLDNDQDGLTDADDPGCYD